MMAGKMCREDEIVGIGIFKVPFQRVFYQHVQYYMCKLQKCEHPLGFPVIPLSNSIKQLII